MHEAEREATRLAFLTDAGWSGVQVSALRPDASFRRYFRVRGADRAAILMDAPPARESADAFVRVAQHLSRLGLHAPQIYAHDLEAGLVLLEDFGDDTFTRLLESGADEHALYCSAVDVLSTLHRHAQAADVDVPAYDTALLIDEAVLLVDWYYPAVRGAAATATARQAFVDLWRRILDALPQMDTTLVLRDFHVDNLMRVTADDGSTDCGLLDFQDAVIGAPAYDLMSLLEDARRDVARTLVEAMTQRYHHAMQTPDADAFDTHFRVLAAQRHCKVAGIFVRLCRRDGKCGYLEHIPRVIGLLHNHLPMPALQPLRAWLDEHLPRR